MKPLLPIFFGRDRGMGFFLAFLVLMTIIVPTFNLSRPERLALTLIFALTLVSGALVTIGLRILRYVVIALTISAVTADMIAEFVPSLSRSEWDAALKLVCISILVFMTLKQTFRPGAVTVHRVMGGIAGYLLIGLTWMFAYQLVVEALPGAIHFESPLEGAPAQQPANLIYFSFATLTTVGYGDAYPVHRIARSLAIAEALIGQLYLAILIATLVGMALHARTAAPEKPSK
jgi:hypothetical protein